MGSSRPVPLHNLAGPPFNPGNWVFFECQKSDSSPCKKGLPELSRHRAPWLLGRYGPSTAILINDTLTDGAANSLIALAERLAGCGLVMMNQGQDRRHGRWTRPVEGLPRGPGDGWIRVIPGPDALPKPACTTVALIAQRPGRSARRRHAARGISR